MDLRKDLKERSKSSDAGEAGKTPDVVGGFYVETAAQVKAKQTSKWGIILLSLVGLIILSLIVGFIYLGEEVAAPLLLFVLGVLAIVGIFTLFASAVGMVKFGQTESDSAEQFKVLEALDDAHVVTSHDGRILYADASYAQLTGAVTPQDIRSVERVFGIEHGMSEPVFRLSVAVAERRQAREEMRLEHPLVGQASSGPSSYWYEVSTHPIGQLKGHETSDARTIWRVKDVTQQRLEQEAAFEKLQNIINYLDHAPTGFFSATPDGKIIYMNATLASWLGFDLAEFTEGQTFLYDIIRGDGAALLNAIQAAPGHTKMDVVDVDFVKRNGQSLPVRLLHATLFGDDGAPGPTRTMVLNRLEMRASGEATPEPGARFSRFFNSAPIAIASLSAEGHLKRANAAFVKLFEVTSAKDTQETLIELVSESDREKLQAAVDDAQKGLSEIEPVDVALSGEGEASARLFISAVERNEEENEIAVVYAIDTTQQRAFEQQFAQGQKMQAIGQLAGGIAHDFNNMLTAIIGFSDLLLQNHGPADPSFQDIMNIKNNANRAAGLVRQLLAFSRRQTLRPTVIDLRDIIEDLCILLERLLGENVRLSVVHGRDLWAVKADLNQLEQVIINLSVNARDAMPDGGDLKISTRNILAADCDTEEMQGLVPADYVAIEVTDTGTGMTPEVLEKIFEPFFSTKGVGEGTGLGLATVYGIIKQTGGYVYPVSEVGKGTTFKILLPRHIAEDTAVEEAQPVEVPRDLSGTASILLVEDEEAVRAFAARAIQARGYTVYEAASGVEGVEVMEEVGGEIDLVVSDVVMPEMDGPTLLRELRKVRPNLKFIFVSGYAEEAFEKHLDEGEEFSFLPKPYTLKQLVTKVKEVLEE